MNCPLTRTITFLSLQEEDANKRRSARQRGSSKKKVRGGSSDEDDEGQTSKKKKGAKAKAKSPAKGKTAKAKAKEEENDDLNEEEEEEEDELLYDEIEEEEEEEEVINAVNAKAPKEFSVSDFSFLLTPFWEESIPLLILKAIYFNTSVVEIIIFKVLGPGWNSGIDKVNALKANRITLILQCKMSP